MKVFIVFMAYSLDSKLTLNDNKVFFFAFRCRFLLASGLCYLLYYNNYALYALDVYFVGLSFLVIWQAEVGENIG